MERGREGRVCRARRLLLREQADLQMVLYFWNADNSLAGRARQARRAGQSSFGDSSSRG